MKYLVVQGHDDSTYSQIVQRPKKNTQGMRDAGEEGKGEIEAKCEQLVWVQDLWELYTHYNFSVKFEIIDIHKISKSRVGRKRK